MAHYYQHSLGVLFPFPSCSKAVLFNSEGSNMLKNTLIQISGAILIHYSLTIVLTHYFIYKINQDLIFSCSVEANEKSFYIPVHL